MSERWAKRIALALVAIPVALFASHRIWPTEGSASNGKVVDGRYYVRTAPGYKEVSLEKGYREVSEGTWRQQYWREVALKWSFFGVCFILWLLWVGSRLRERSRTAASVQGADTGR